jgi:hypothetical protein
MSLETGPDNLNCGLRKAVLKTVSFLLGIVKITTFLLYGTQAKA